MSDIENARRALIQRILEGDGKAARITRNAAFDDSGLSGPAQIMTDKVVNNAYRVTDGDIAAVKASGLSEDEVFEVVVCAAVGQAARQYEAARAALEATFGEDERAPSSPR
ncbi:hypothetical protein ACPOL_0853 [Acidisarcina polymorpha]|uniref:Uncharacterized protein n=1 Tax=Acidisarcina polymorpha TaxID=2211140 RepID=A0A2Z5FTT0_9BACT|nr:hypothetical protein [Acidisarcina polymorpha]AXC10210.1 hypothetical protein ACPOL_0853 [Acidisarcina polymorpha]